MQTRPEVYVNRAGTWHFRSSPIENESILNYFKKNLKRDAEGKYYIENRFGELKEEGYIQGVEGFPLIIRTLQFEPEPSINLECEQTYSLEPDRIGAEAGTESTILFQQDDATLWTLVFPEDSPEAIPARLSGPCMASLHTAFQDTDEGICLTANGTNWKIIERNASDYFQTIDKTPPAPEDNPAE